MFKPNTALGTVSLQILASILFVLLVAIFSWVIGRLKWHFHNYRIRKMILSNRDFRFVFNPPDNQSKILTFLCNGDIGKGRNNNEHTWKISKGKLQIFGADKKIYSRFKFNSGQGKLIHTNDIDTRSIQGQFIIPMWERSSK